MISFRGGDGWNRCIDAMLKDLAPFPTGSEATGAKSGESAVAGFTSGRGGISGHVAATSTSVRPAALWFGSLFIAFLCFIEASAQKDILVDHIGGTNVHVERGNVKNEFQVRVSFAMDVTYKKNPRQETATVLHDASNREARQWSPRPEPSCPPFPPSNARKSKASPS